MPSKLEQLQQQYRRQLLQEKEERMIKIHTDNQQKALSKISKYNGSMQASMGVIKPPSSINAPQPHHSPIKKGSPGVDRSRPLPPITKEPKISSYQVGPNTHQPVSNSFQQSYQSTRTSPVSAPIENGTRSANANSRSRSVDLEAKSSPSRNGVISKAPTRNGYSRPAEPEVKHSLQSVAEPSKKPDQDLIQKLKQAELQRLKANNKVQVRDETPPKNGFSNMASKSSNAQKKASTTKPVPPSTSYAPKSKPATQPRASPIKKTTVGMAGQKIQGSSKDTAPRKPPGPGQEQCRVCGRNFNADRIEKHRSICQKAAQKKVKVFDATKMRVKGTEAEQFVKKGVQKAQPKQAKKSDWRKKHNDFIEAIRQAKMVQQHLANGGKVSDLPPPPPSDTSDYVPCPHCGRKFNVAVAERHIPKCKNILSNKKNPAATVTKRK